MGIITIESPARSELPPPSPNVVKRLVAKRGKTDAKTERKRSLPALIIDHQRGQSVYLLGINKENQEPTGLKRRIWGTTWRRRPESIGTRGRCPFGSDTKVISASRSNERRPETHGQVNGGKYDGHHPVLVRLRGPSETARRRGHTGQSREVINEARRDTTNPKREMGMHTAAKRAIRRRISGGVSG